jgi:ATP-dependent exoDNAse (exonuclease V) alpha subunit
MKIPQREERIRAIAHSYAESSGNTLIVSPDNASRRELNLAVREELKRRGDVGLDDHSFRVLIPRQDMTGAERAWANHYEIGDIVRYTRGSKSLEVDSGSYGTVVAINSSENLLTIEKPSGEAVTYDPRRLTGISVYRQVTRDFSVGDRIQFTAPDKQLGVANRDLALIQCITPDGRISARLEGGRQIEFSAGEHRHLDHGYAVTSYSAQGLTSESVIVHADTGVHPELLNSRFGYVSVSRATHEAMIFTNDAGRLNQQVRAEITKTSALQISEPSHTIRGIAMSI